MSETSREKLERWCEVNTLGITAPIREAIRAVLAQLEKPLDVPYTTSCGHTWTMRHTACPTCFGELKAERDALTEKLSLVTEDYIRERNAAEQAESALREMIEAEDNEAPIPRGWFARARAALRDTAPVEGFFARGEDGQYHPDPAPAEDRSTAPWDAWKAAEARVRELEEVIVAFADFWYLDATFAGIEAVAKQIRERRPKP